MIQSYKSRKIEVGQRVKVYFNVRLKLFSIRDCRTGLIVAHGNNISLGNVKFTVSEKGRQRVIRDKVKNVHAYAIGEYIGDEPIDTTGLDKAYYNPYTTDNFVIGVRKLEISNLAYFSNKNVFVKLPSL